MENMNIGTAFYYIAILSTVLFVIKMFIFAVFGGHTEVSADVDVNFETDTAFNFFSVQSILAFLMGVGWAGLAALKQWNLSIVFAVLVGIVIGLIFMFLTAYLMFLTKKLNKTVKPDYSSCVGKSGETYTAFKASGDGQIKLDVNGKSSVEAAINAGDEEIPAFAKIKIVDYKNKMFYIEKL